MGEGGVWKNFSRNPRQEGRSIDGIRCPQLRIRPERAQGGPHFNCASFQVDARKLYAYHKVSKMRLNGFHTISENGIYCSMYI